MSQPTPEAAQLVKQLMEQPGNNMCADCQRKISKWASTTLGIFICIDCSGIHRNLGTHISFVRSCTLDSWTPEQARVMKRVGNERANEYWEARLPPEFIRPSTADRAGMEYFIRQKYVNKCWAADGDPPQFRTAARTGGRSNVRPSINMYNGYFQHNPMAQPQPPTNQTIISANARKTLSVSRSNDNLESVRKPAHKSASMGLADFMNMMNQAQTQSDDTDDVSDNNSNNNSIPPQSPVAQQNDFYNHPPPPSPIQPVTTPQATTSPSPIQPVATPQAAAGTSPAQHSQLKSNPLPKPKSSPPQQQPQQAYPTTGSTAHDIMAAAQNDPGKGKRGKKGVARFMKRPSNDAVFDQMLKMSENSCRPESAPIIQAPPQ